MIGLLSQHDILRLDTISSTERGDIVAVVSNEKPFKASLETLSGGIVNPTEEFIPIRRGGKFVDSDVRFDTDNDRYVTTKDWQFPSASVFVGEDVTLTNNAGFLSRVSMTVSPDSTNIILDRFYDFSGTEESISVVQLDPFEWGTFQPTFDTEIDITSIAPVIVSITQLENAFNRGHILRGVSGKMRFDISMNPAQPVGQTGAQAVVDFLANPENFVKIVDGALDMEDIDFDNHAPDAWATTIDYEPLDTVTESATTYTCLESHTSGTFATDLAANKWRSYDGVQVVYKSDKDFIVGKNLVTEFYSADGNDVTVLGGDFGGGLEIPYFETVFSSRFSQNLELQPKTATVTTSPYTVTDEDILLVDPAVLGAEINILLPTSASRFDSVTEQVRPITVKNIHNNNAVKVRVTPDGSEEIEEDTDALLNKGVSLTLSPDGTDWWTI